jgi:hypothetical protein
VVVVHVRLVVKVAGGGRIGPEHARPVPVGGRHAYFRKQLLPATDDEEMELYKNS